MPEAWTSFELSRFSHGKHLFDYQQKALQNVSKVLWKYYEDFSDYHPRETGDANRWRKHLLWRWYQDNGLLEDFSIEPKSTFSDLLLEYHMAFGKDGWVWKPTVQRGSSFRNRMGQPG